MFSIWTPPFIADRNANKEVHFCIWEPNENRQFVVFVAVIGHYVPCLIMVGCYIKVFIVMRKQSKRIATNTAASMATGSAFQRTYVTSKTDRSQTVSSSVVESEGTNGTKPGQNNGVMKQDKVRHHLLEVQSISANVTERDKVSSTMDSGTTSIAPATSNRSRDKKIFITLTYVIGSYLICWFPFYITFDTYAWAPELVPSGLYSFFFWMTYVNSTLNPFIYAYTSKDFRSAFARVIRGAYSCKFKD